MSKLSFKGKKVLIHGLGLNKGGIGMVRYFAKHGAQICITDLRDGQTLKPSIDKLQDVIKKNKIKLILGEHRLKDFAWADIVIRNPAIPPNNKYIEYAKEHGADVYMEMSLFYKLKQGITIGITGTKGKSTTTMLIYEIIKSYKQNVFLGGNIGKSAIEFVHKLNENSITVLELSSFQLSVMRENKQSPHIAVITNILTDHINWHKTKEHYVWSKLGIIASQTKNDYLIVNLDSPEINRILKQAHSKIIGITLNKDLLKKYSRYLHNYLYYDDKSRFIIDKKGNKIKINWDLLHIKGMHNVYNIMLAIGATVYTDINIPLNFAIDAITRFTGIYGRQQLILEKNGIYFYNDTSATVDAAVFAATNRFYEEFNNQGKSSVYFIMGGVDKGIDYEQLLKYMKNKVAYIILFEGNASDKIMHYAKKYNIPVTNQHKNMCSAVKSAIKLVLQDKSPKKVIVLEPGASSFNMFLNEWDRGKQFDDCVTKLAKSL